MSGDEFRTVAPEALAPGRLMRSLGLAPRKGLGQNFLVSKSALRHIMGALELCGGDTVIEVGAGAGTLTGFLAAHAGAVVAVELDDRLAEYLRLRFAEVQNVRIVQADILAVVPQDLLPSTTVRYKVAGNLPYYLTSAAIRQVLDWRPSPELMVVMVQEEVARRIVAAPGDMSLLSLMVQLAGRPEMVARVPPGAFVPAPKVSSAIVRVRPYPERLASAQLEAAVFELARAGFHQRRKTLLNALASGGGMQREQARRLVESVGLPEKARAEELSAQQWIELARQVQPVGRDTE